MKNNDTKGDDSTSKIEKIRQDLERKLAALEAAKKKRNTKPKEIITNKSDDAQLVESKKDKAVKTISKVNKTEKLSNKKEERGLNQNFAFELTDEIVPAKNKKLNSTKENLSKKSSAKSKKETIKSVKQKVVVKKPIPIKKDNRTTKQKVVAKKPIPIKKDNRTTKQKIVAKKPIPQKKNSDNIKEKTQPKKTKKFRLNYLIYFLAGALILTLGYFSFDYYSESRQFDQNKVDSMISKFKNRSYLDSIELADAQNQLIDIKDQSILDSIADVNFAQLESELEEDDDDSNTANTKKTIESRKKNPIISTTNPNRVSEIDSKNTTPTEKLKKESTDTKTVESNNTEETTNETVANNDSTSKTEDTKEETPETKEDKNPTIAIKKSTKKPAIQTAAIYPGCGKKRTEKDKKKCLLTKMSRYVSRNFNVDLAQDLGLKPGLNKIKVSFIIDKNGKSKVLSVRVPDKRLEKEAKRVVHSLPKMIPAKSDGVAKSVKYNIPILFNVKN